MARRSDIFDSYAKIAEEKGLISLAEEQESSQPAKPKESAKLKRYKKDSYPRMGSDDLSTIEALYGVKPDNSIKYELNIMEAAHPKPVVIAPSYDKINGLVENNIERQNIISNIALKPTNGNIDQRKYAQKELVMELVRLANDLDNSGNEELRVIADKCIEDISSEKKKSKTAGILDDVGDWISSKKDWFGDHLRDAFQTAKGYGTGAVVGGVLGALIGAIAGEGVGAAPGWAIGSQIGRISGALIAAMARTSPQVISIAHNAEDTSNQINDLVKKIPATDPEHAFLVSFQKELANVGSLSEDYNRIISTLQSEGQNLNDADVQKSKDVATALSQSMDKINSFGNQFNERVGREVYQQYLPNSKLLTPVYEFISDDVEDVQDSIRSLMQAINNFKVTMSKVNQAAGAASQQIAEKPVESPEQSKAVKVQDKESDEETGEDSDESGEDEDDGAFSKLMDFLGHKPSDKELDFFRSLK